MRPVTPATVVRALALALYLVAVVWPGVSYTFDLGNPQLGAAVCRFGVGMLLIAAAGLSHNREALGIVLAVASIAALSLQFIYFSDLIFYGGFLLVVALPAFSWAVSHPFRGSGFAVVGAGSLLAFAYPWFIPEAAFMQGTPLPLAFSALDVAIVVTTVWLSIRVERRWASKPKSAVLA